MNIQLNGTPLPEGVVTPIQADFRCTMHMKGDEIVVYAQNGRGLEVPALNWTLPAGYSSKYTQPVAPLGPVYLRPRQPLVFRFTTGQPIVRTSPLMKHVPMGAVWAYDDPQGNNAGGGGIGPMSAPDEWIADHVIARMPIACYEVEDIEPGNYYRLVNSWNGSAWNKTTQLKRYCAKKPGQSIYDDSRVPVNVSAVTAPYVADLMAYQQYDGQHLTRGIEYLDPHDPAHALFLADLCRDIGFAWDDTRANAYLQGPTGTPSDIGREVAWCLNAATRARNAVLARRFQAIIRHEANQFALTQALSFGYGGLAPDPWLYCGVDRTVRVAQRMEMDHLCWAAQKAGMNDFALKLAMQLHVHDRTPMKWIDADTGQGVGTYPEDAFTWPESWSAGMNAALAIGNAQARVALIQALTRQRIPTAQGSVQGPWGDTATVLSKLIAENNPGQTGDAIAVIRGIGK